MVGYLADELLAEILTRLPVKCIIQCRCVCKSWRSLISSPYFIAFQLRKSNNNNAQIFVLHQKPFLRDETNLLHFEESHQNHHFQLLRLQSNSILEFVGCTNGLICFALHSGKFYRKFVIFNPEIGCFVTVPAPSKLSIYKGVKGFGFDEITLDYKIFLAYPADCVYLCSLNSGSWNSIPCPNSWYHDDSVVFVNGSFHWVAYDSNNTPSSRNLPYIMVFDLKSEAFRRIWIPFSEGVYREFIIVKHGKSSIGVIQRKRKNLTHVWVKINLDHTESPWEQLASKVWIGDRRKSCIEAQEVVGLKSDEELVIRFFDGRVVSQNIGTKTVCDLFDTKIDGYKFCSAHTYVPNLILLDTEKPDEF